VTTPAGPSTGGTNLFTYVAALLPSVTAISPNHGTTLGGTGVTITGTNFTGATAVTIGGTPAQFVTVVSATSITATTPAHAAGAVNVVVTTPAGTGTGTGLFTFFVAEYLNFERVHLYTYDLFAERVGFKLGWGCLVFYPFFYCVGLWSVAERPNPHTPLPLLVACGLLFFSGWALSRGANLQKFLFKIEPRAKLFGVIAPEVVAGGGKQLLCSGFWGLARHINYLGEILMALGLTLSLGYLADLVPWLYPVYYVVLLFPRERDDDRRCAEKYGALWQEYCRRVPRRIVPGLY